MPNSTFTLGLLTDELVSLADELRGLYTELGARPYRVFVVRRAWSGSRVGEGTATETETEIVPRPAVLTKVRGELRPAGLEEEGNLVVAEVSLTWTEPELYSPALAGNEQHLFRLADAHGQLGRSRFYVPSAPPVPVRGDAMRDDVLGWTIELRRVEA
jgi:hypothetical protein